jgi:hypothetical protein
MSANAAVVAPANNDIFLAFRASGNLGASTSYLVNLGQYSQFRDAAPNSTITLSVGDVSADLVATYGSNWNSRPDLYWAVFGVSNTASPTLYASQAEPTPGTLSNAWPLLDSISRSSTASQIVSVLQGVNGYQGSDSTSNSTVAVLQTNSANSSSYNKQVATAGTTDFGSVSGWSGIEGNFGAGTSGTALDLYRISSSAVTNPGHFTLSDAGIVSFTGVPEPSVSMAGTLGALLLLTKRRRNQSV